MSPLTNLVAQERINDMHRAASRTGYSRTTVQHTRRSPRRSRRRSSS